MTAEEASWKLNLPGELSATDRANIAQLVRRQAADIAAIEKAVQTSGITHAAHDANGYYVVVYDDQPDKVSPGRGPTLADACRAATK